MRCGVAGSCQSSAARTTHRYVPIGQAEEAGKKTALLCLEQCCWRACPDSQSGCVVTNVISIYHSHAVFGQHPAAVIHHTSIYSDKRMPEMPPLSEAAQSVAQSLLVRGVEGMKQRSRRQRGMDLALAGFPGALRGWHVPHLGGSKIPPGKCFRGFLAANRSYGSIRFIFTIFMA